MNRYSTREVAGRLGLDWGTIQRYIAAGKIPAPSVQRLGGGKFRVWTEQDIEKVRKLLPFVTLAFETGARFNVVRTLQWSNIDFKNRCLQFGKGKTKSGSGRVVPLSPRALSSTVSVGLEGCSLGCINPLSHSGAQK